MRTGIDGDENELPEAASCWCCGLGAGDVEGLVRLQEHAEVAICFVCLDLLNNNRAQQVRELKRRWGRMSLRQRLRNRFPAKDF